MHVYKPKPKSSSVYSDMASKVKYNSDSVYSIAAWPTSWWKSAFRAEITDMFLRIYSYISVLLFRWIVESPLNPDAPKVAYTMKLPWHCFTIMGGVIMQDCRLSLFKKTSKLGFYKILSQRSNVPKSRSSLSLSLSLLAPLPFTQQMLVLFWCWKTPLVS